MMEELNIFSLQLFFVKHFFLTFLSREKLHKTTPSDFLCNLDVHYLQGRIQRFWKRVVLYVGHHGWPAKKILGFRWSKKAEIALESISFWQNISISFFKLSPFLSIKSYQFFKIY